jgi:hypothetical protein
MRSKRIRSNFEIVETNYFGKQRLNVDPMFLGPAGFFARTGERDAMKCQPSSSLEV